MQDKNFDIETSKPNASDRDDGRVARQAGSAMNSAGRGSKRKSSSAFRTISEVAKLLGVQQHVLRFWETKFSHVKPLKRGGGRRYYRPEDVELLQAIHNLLYIEGYTIKGAQKLIKDIGKNKVVAMFKEVDETTQEERAALRASNPEMIGGAANAKKREALEDVLEDLKDLRRSIKK